jgi:hypothetical protein
VRRDGGLRRGVVLRAGPAAGRNLRLEPRDIGFEIVEPQQEGVEPPRLHFPAPFPPVHEQSDIARRGVLLAAEAEQLDLKLAFIQRGLSAAAKRLQLAIQAIHYLRHVNPSLWK